LAAKNPKAARSEHAFADVVRAPRNVLGLSQEQLGRSPGWNRIAISRIETADRLPSLDRVFVLADALETAVPDLRELAHALKMSYFA
jgi:transcriptional regulator with XRE-family HTH domain